jgi:hypothetical protein
MLGIRGTNESDPNDPVLSRMFKQTKNEDRTMLLQVVNAKKEALRHHGSHSRAEKNLLKDLDVATSEAKPDLNVSVKTSQKPVTTQRQDILIRILVAVTTALLDKELAVNPEKRFAAQQQCVAFIVQAIFLDKTAEKAFTDAVKAVDGKIDGLKDMCKTAAKNAAKKLLICKIFSVEENSEDGAVFCDLIDAYDAQNSFFNELKERDNGIPTDFRGDLEKLFLPSEGRLCDETSPSASSKETVRFLLQPDASETVSSATAAAASSVARFDSEDFPAETIERFLTKDWNNMETRFQIAQLAAQHYQDSSIFDATRAAILEEIDPSVRNYVTLPGLGSFPPSSDLAGVLAALASITITGRNDGIVPSHLAAVEVEAGGSGSSPTVAEVEVPHAGDVFILENFLRNRKLWNLLDALPETCPGAENEELKVALAMAKDYPSFPETTIQKAGAGLLHIHDDFRITKLLGAGGHGVVFEAHHKDSPKIRLAIKFLFLAKPQLPNVMSRELLIQASLDTKFVVATYGWYMLVERKGKIAIAILMELGDETLEEFREKQVQTVEHGSSEDQVELLKINLPIFVGLVEGLVHMHSLGVVHRDFKTESKCFFVHSASPLFLLLLISFCSDVLFFYGNPKIADFGTGKQDTFGAKRDTKDVGTDGYQAPEARLGDYSEKTDIFSFGCVVYEMLTGVLPYAVAKKTERYDKDIFKNPKIGAPLSNLLEKLLDGDAGLRPSAEEALTDIKTLIKIVDGETGEE